MKECVYCGSTRTIKNGTVNGGKPKRKCKDCGRQYTLGATKEYISEEKWEMVEKMYLEGMSIRGIHRVTGISLSWLMIKTKRFAEQVDEHIETPEPTPKKSQD